MFASTISTFSVGLWSFSYVHAEINFLTFYFDPGFVEKICCISEGSIAMPSQEELHVYAIAPLRRAYV